MGIPTVALKNGRDFWEIGDKNIYGVLRAICAIDYLFKSTLVGFEGDRGLNKATYWRRVDRVYIKKSCQSYERCIG
jgi:hypothetical protein